MTSTQTGFSPGDFPSPRTLSRIEEVIAMLELSEEHDPIALFGMKLDYSLFLTLLGGTMAQLIVLIGVSQVR